MKFIYIIFLFSLACTNLFIDEKEYNSFLFKGGSWIEFPKIEDMIIEDYNFSMQFWVSGGEINGSEAPALFSITDNNETKLALYRDPNINNSIILNINSQIVKLPELNIDWSKSNDFNLISILFSDNTSTSIFIDDTKVYTSNSMGEYFVSGGDFNSLPPNAQTIDFCEEDRCEDEKIHYELDGGPHLEGSYFNNFEGELDLLTPLYMAYYPAIDTSLVNNHKHLTHSTWNTNYSSLESESWSRKLDYLFTNYQNWTLTGDTDNSILETSDHAPVTAILYFNQ